MTSTTIEAAAFWDGTHPLSALQEELHEKLVPAQGRCDSQHGELLRCAGNLYYDVYNNGYCNAEVLAEQLSFTAGFRDSFEPLLMNRDSLKHGLGYLLRGAGSKADDTSSCEEALHLEDVMTAIIKYVAMQDGRTVPEGLTLKTLETA